MEEPSVCMNPATEIGIVIPNNSSRSRSPISTPGSGPISPSASSDGCEPPECKCAICLGRLRNKSVIDSCFHEFCFECLVEWSKVKAECPLCKTKFDYIVHNVRSNGDYEKYHCQSNQHDNHLQIPWIEENRSFRYRTTMGPHIQDRIPVHDGFAQARRGLPPRYLRNSTRIPENRRRIYRENLWVQPMSDVTNRFRESSPLFYRENPAQVHRLLKWLQRELSVLLPPDSPDRTFVLQRIINNLFRHSIRSPFFASVLQPYLGSNTRHFLHEFAEYARSPYDMVGHDNEAVYLPYSSVRSIEEVVLNSPTSSELSVDDSEASHSCNSDLEIIEESHRVLPVAGPSGVSRPMVHRSPIMPLSNEDTHEIISSSSSDECEIVGSFKPPTPEVIDIISSEEDLPQVQEENIPDVSAVTEDRLTPLLEPINNLPLDEVPSHDRPRIIIKIEPNRLKRKLKRKRRIFSDEIFSSSSSESASSDSRCQSSSSRDLPASNEGYTGHRRIPSVVVPQPSFKMDGTLRYFSEEDLFEGNEEIKEKSKKKKKHSKKHKRSHRNKEEEDRGEGTSGSSNSRKCRVCRHKRCQCKSQSSKKYKRIKYHHKESTEERESTSGSSRSKAKSKKDKYPQVFYSNNRYSDSSD